MDRRDFVKTGGIALTGLLAGCSQGSSEGEKTENDTTDESTETTTSTGDSSYSVSMEPMGEVTFDAVPETWVANNGSWADMGVALGREPPAGVWLTSRYHTQYYDEIPGVSVDKSGMTSLYSDGVSKETIYSLDADVHVIDPNFLMNRFKGWDESDVEDIRTNVGPFFGNSIFSRGYDWHDDYKFYTLYEAFEKLAELFQRTDRYEAFASYHETVQSNIDSVVPSSGRPSAAVLWAGDQPESFLPYIINEGTSFKHLNDLQVGDALAETGVKDFHSNRGEIGYETLLDVDPEVVLLRGHESKTREQFETKVVQFMKNHGTASELTAVKNGDVYRAGPLYQGPITNLVVTQRLAENLYDVSENIYDPQRVSDIVAGSN